MIVIVIITVSGPCTPKPWFVKSKRRRFHEKWPLAALEKRRGRAVELGTLTRLRASARQPAGSSRTPPTCQSVFSPATCSTHRHTHTAVQSRIHYFCNQLTPLVSIRCRIHPSRSRHRGSNVPIGRYPHWTLLAGPFPCRRGRNNNNNNNKSITTKNKRPLTL